MNAILLAIAASQLLRRCFGRSLFACAIAGLAGRAPLVLLAGASFLAASATQRAQMVVAGSGRILLALCAALLLRGAYVVLSRRGQRQTADWVGAGGVQRTAQFA